MYLTLCSDSSKLFFGDNTVACFSTQLPQQICATGDVRYEVGVAEVFLPPLQRDSTHSPIYLYTDITKPVLVADTAARLLRIITPHGETGHHEFVSVHYIPVEKQNFSTVTVSFYTKTGERYPFPDGEHPSIVVLHFREVSANK